MNSYFLPVGLILALLMGCLIPAPGAFLHQLGLIPWMVVTIFFINGTQSSVKELPHGRKLVPVSIIAILISLFISPFIGLAVVSAVSLPLGAAIGLVVIATVPPTLSSGIVMTQIVRGNVAKALFLTILLNLIGVFTIPFMLPFILDNVSTITISPLPLLKQLILIVLIPFLAGIFSKPVTSIYLPHSLLRYLPSSCVIATVWMSLSTSSDTLKELNFQLLLLIIICALTIHGALLLLCWLSKYLYQPERSEWLALLFTASQKTLPVALGVLVALNQAIELAMIACIIFHFLQLFVDSMITSRMKPI